MTDQPSQSRELKPFVMFKDKNQTEDGVKDFRPLRDGKKSYKGKTAISNVPKDWEDTIKASGNPPAEAPEGEATPTEGAETSDDTPNPKDASTDD